MPKTNFIGGITAVTAEFLNKIFTHVHDGNDQDGSAPKVDPDNHIDWSDHVTIAGGQSNHTITHTASGNASIVSDELRANTDVKIGGDSIKPVLAQAHGTAVVAWNGSAWVVGASGGHNFDNIAVDVATADHLNVTLSDASNVSGVAVGAVHETNKRAYFAAVEWTSGSKVRLRIFRHDGTNVIANPTGSSPGTPNDSLHVSWVVF